MNKKTALDRLKRLRAKLAEQQLDAFYASHTENLSNPNVQYLSGFAGSTAIILITPKDAFIITDARYFERVEQEVVGFELKKLTVGATYGDFVSEIIQKMGIKNLGFDSNHTIFSSYRKLRDSLPGVELKGVQQLVEDMRVVKSAEEIELIRKSCEVSVEAFKRLIDLDVKGRTEKELAAFLDYHMRLFGAEKQAFDTILCSGPRSSIIHGTPSDNELKPGDLVIVDFGASMNGYCADFTRTCVVAEPSAEQQRLFSILKKAQQAAARAAVPDAPCKDIDAAARDVIKAEGLGDAFSHGLGHGIGLRVHEGPQVGPTSESVMQANMVTTIEPGVYFPGQGGLRLEDDFVITQQGAVRITEELEQELFVLKYE